MSMKRTGTGALVACGLVAATLLVSAPAQARITRIEITSTESPTFEGTSFGDAGQYEKLRGRAFGEVDPNAFPDNKITDIKLAPRNSRGMVEYSTEIIILRPIDAAKGNHRLFYELSNRGTVLALRVLNNGPGAAPTRTDYPSTAADAGNGFLMRQGYTMLFSGWDTTAPPGGGRLLTTVPIAKNPDGSSIVGPALEELIFDNVTTQVGRLTYPAATLDQTQAMLTVRTHYADTPVEIPASGWEYVTNRSIRLLPAGTTFAPGRLYEFKYPATDPTVAGLSFAIVRDLSAFFKNADADDAGNPNPIAGQAKLVYANATSQPARLLRDYIDLGFNQVGRHGKAIDGILNWIAGGSGGFFNYRFAQPFRTHRQHIARYTPERIFPFAWQLLFDPVTKQLDGRIVRCTLTRTCPKIIEANSANEYWVKGGSLLHTDTRGHDLLREPRDVRLYFFSSYPHLPSAGTIPICQQPLNPLTPGIGMRPLLVDLDDWVSRHRAPPRSRLPRRVNGTLVPSLPQAQEGFPNIPGVTYNGLMTTGDLFDFGPQFKQGILTTLPPIITSPYPVFVPKTDEDGNDIAGVRFPNVAVPTATYTGWALRTAAFAGDDLCDAFGQRIPFAQTKAERLAKGDPRLSIEERYPTHENYVNKVAKAARKLERERFLVPEDVDQTIQAAEDSDIGK